MPNNNSVLGDALKNGKLSANQVLQFYDCLGVPHFQRGLIWSNSNARALLESLYHKTPCGSFVFWQPAEHEDFNKYGVPLGDKKRQEAARSIEYFIVDGQQRIRSLYCVKNDSPVSHEEDDEDEVDEQGADDNGKIWLVNLSVERTLSKYFEDTNKHNPMFLYGIRPEKRSENDPLKGMVVALRKFLSEEFDDRIDWQAELITLRNDAEQKQREFEREYRKVADKVRKMWTSDESFRLFKLPCGNASEAVRAYNRINSGGKRVEAEEKAFAELTDIDPKTYERITVIFDNVHDHTEGETSKRNVVLRREKERNFGFKLFLKVLALVCNYHFDRSLGSNSVSFSIFFGRQFREKFEILENPDVVYMWKITEDTISCLKTLISKELNCDDLRFLPEVSSLLPVAQLLIRYPQLAKAPNNYRSLLASLCLKLLLADLPPNELQELTKRFRKTESPVKAVKDTITQINIFAGRLEEKPRNMSAKKFKTKLEKKLENSNALMGRYTLLLYWLLRRDKKNRIWDFSYGNKKPNKNSALQSGKEVEVSEKCEPEKQHIIPFAGLRSIYGESASRAATHPVNNIGNITYISSVLNGWENGLGQNMMDLELEKLKNPKNVGAHFLKGGGLKKSFDKLRQLLEDTEPGSNNDNNVKEEFKRFCQMRRKLIAKGFYDWLKKIDREMRMDLPTAKKVSVSLTPDSKRFTEDLDGIVMKRHYDQDTKNCLLWILKLLKEQKKLGYTDENMTPPQILLGCRRRSPSWGLTFALGEDSVTLSVGKNVKKPILNHWAKKRGLVRSKLELGGSITVYSRNGDVNPRILKFFSDEELVSKLANKLLDAAAKKTHT